VLASRSWPSAVLAAAALALLGPASAHAGAIPKAREGAALDWSSCGGGFECATLTVPLDYDRRSRGTLDLPVTRKPATDRAHRIGTLFVDFGGPGDPTADSLRAGNIAAFAALNDRYDILGWDPRGTGGTDAIDCKSDQERLGIYAQPFPRPDSLDTGAFVKRVLAYEDRCAALNPRILPYVTTAATARDMDRIRQALGEDRANYFGYSYGTYLGATYESLFGDHVGRFVLDGALDPTQYANDPIQALRSQTNAFEVALGRFFQACAAHQDACLGFGGEDPAAAFDALVDSMNAAPLPAGGSDPRPVDGDDLLAGSLIVLYAKQNWPALARALHDAANGDGTFVRVLSDAFYARNADGTYDPISDRYVAISAVDQRWPRDTGAYLGIGAADYELFGHYWFNSGYADLTEGLWPARSQEAYLGPFKGSASAPATLVVGTTYDPATPYKGAKRLVAELGNARLLTMAGDGHTAYPGNSGCIDAAVEAYLKAQQVPPAGTVCRQEVPFQQPQQTARQAAAGARGSVLHVKPFAIR
jgi:pimeloyl-ACP methyl ester carboxylesterase